MNVLSVPVGRRVKVELWTASEEETFVLCESCGAPVHKAVKITFRDGLNSYTTVFICENCIPKPKKNKIDNKHLLYCLKAARYLKEKGYQYISIDLGQNLNRADIAALKTRKNKNILALVEVKVSENDLYNLPKQLPFYMLAADYVYVCVPSDLYEKTKEILNKHKDKFKYVGLIVFNGNNRKIYPPRKNRYKNIDLGKNYILEEISRENTNNIIYFVDLFLKGETNAI